MYNQVSRCFKTTGSDHSVCIILSESNNLVSNFFDQNFMESIASVEIFDEMLQCTLFEQKVLQSILKSHPL